MKQPSAADYELIPPDGGWGWMVVLGVALNTMTSMSLGSVFSVLFGDKLTEMGHKTTSAAVIMSIRMAVMQFSGLLVAPLLKKYSIRQVSVFGGCLVVVGVTLTSFANSVIHIIVTYSICVGLGSGLVSPSSFLVVKTYFLKARGRAVGMSMAGGNVGQMAMPHLVSFLLERYGFSGALLVLGGVTMHGPMGGLFFHPLEWHAERRPLAGELKPLKADTGGDATADAEASLMRRSKRYASSLSLANSEMGEVTDVVFETQAKKATPTNEDIRGAGEQKPQPVWRRVASFMDLDLLRSGAFLNTMLGTGSMVTCSVNFTLLLPFYLQRVVGLPLSDTALCLTMLAVGDFLSRLTVPPVTDRLGARPRHIFFVGAVLTALTRSAVAMSSELVTLCVWSALCGFARGVAVVNSNMCVADTCPDHKLPAAVGLNMMFAGVLMFGVGPIVGFVRDKTEDYPLCMHLLSGMLLTAMFSWFIEGVVQWYRQKK
ncbi:monocarboxylate transporter 1-like [Schistocerca gregaria]|uniref:monocarboxylate transporter 1-like n=1 Tax=Schistocerca gregaria TaxID=7010 RepID=UPI00211DFF24|nr:monocarboxylate transporter 1-like [Schistocerca gregaria]